MQVTVLGEVVGEMFTGGRFGGSLMEKVSG